MKMSNSVLRVMNVVWENENISAKNIAAELNSLCGWNKNTTYTVINQCIKKGLIERTEPDFMCRATVSREEAQADELKGMVDSVFKGSMTFMFSTLFENGSLSPKDIEELERFIAKYK